MRQQIAVSRHLGKATENKPSLSASFDLKHPPFRGYTHLLPVDPQQFGRPPHRDAGGRERLPHKPGQLRPRVDLSRADVSVLAFVAGQHGQAAADRRGSDHGIWQVVVKGGANRRFSSMMPAHA